MGQFAPSVFFGRPTPLRNTLDAGQPVNTVLIFALQGAIHPMQNTMSRPRFFACFFAWVSTGLHLVYT